MQYKYGIARPIKCYEIVWGAQVAPSLTRRPSKARVDIHVCVHVCCREDVGHAYVLLAVWRQTGLYSESQKCDGVPGWGPSCVNQMGMPAMWLGMFFLLKAPCFFVEVIETRKSNGWSARTETRKVGFLYASKSRPTPLLRRAATFTVPVFSASGGSVSFPDYGALQESFVTSQGGSVDKIADKPHLRLMGCSITGEYS